MGVKCQIHILLRYYLRHFSCFFLDLEGCFDSNCVVLLFYGFEYNILISWLLCSNVSHPFVDKGPEMEEVSWKQVWSTKALRG